MCFFKYFFGVPHLATYIFLFFYNEPELGVGIDPGMALTPLPSSIGQGSNPKPSHCEPSALPIDHSFCFMSNYVFHVHLKFQLTRKKICQNVKSNSEHSSFFNAFKK
jgi:hypothetical protein